MIVLSVIQDYNQEKICQHCEENIIGHSSMTQHYQCEGRHCEEANECYYEEHPERASALPPFVYKPSEEVKEAERMLDIKIKLFAEDLHYSYDAMVIRNFVSTIKNKTV